MLLAWQRESLLVEICMLGLLLSQCMCLGHSCDTGHRSSPGQHFQVQWSGNGTSYLWSSKGASASLLRRSGRDGIYHGSSFYRRAVLFFSLHSQNGCQQFFAGKYFLSLLLYPSCLAQSLALTKKVGMDLNA